MMRRRLKAALYACLVAACMVVAPILAFRSLPPEMSQMLSMVGMDLQSVLHTIVLVGLVIATLTFIKTDMDEWTIQNLIASAGIEALGFYLTLYGFGLGDPWSFGVVDLQLPIGNVKLTMDFRALIAAYAVITVLSIAVLLLKHRHAKETHSS